MHFKTDTCVMFGGIRNLCKCAVWNMVKKLNLGTWLQSSRGHLTTGF